MKKVCTAFLLLIFLSAFQNHIAAQLNISYTATDNTVCGPVPDCECEGQLVSITVLYRGVSGKTLRVYKNASFNSSGLIATIHNVQDGQLIDITSPGNTRLGPNTYFTIAGIRFFSYARIPTSCSRVQVGATYGNYTLVGYTDRHRNTCEIPLCTASVDLTVAGGNPPYEYRWSNGSASEDLTGLCSGSYRVTVKDRAGVRTSKLIQVGDAACDDNDLCTTDKCVSYECIYTPIDCNDGDACTTDECVEGVCQNASQCDDADLCTIDHCRLPDNDDHDDDDDDDDGWWGWWGWWHNDGHDNDDDDDDGGSNGAGLICINTPIDCREGDYCTVDACVEGECIHTPKDCDDENECTRDACRSSSGNCKHTPIPFCQPLCQNVNCNDNDPCTTDACSDGQCSNIPLNCNDNNLCTTDACNNGQCSHTLINCDDNNSCTLDGCDSGSCISTPVNCNDNDACTIDGCDNGQCAHAARNCDDGNPCTADACQNGLCINAAINCDDNDACTSDGCDNGICISAPVNCDDNDACTIDGCNNGQCAHAARSCDDSDLCTTDACENGSCISAAINCDDNDACTTDGCEEGQCSHITRDCNDNDGCTTDGCGNGQCEHLPIAGCGDPCAQANCSDNDDCTIDVCIDGFCQFNTITCDDNDPCTLDDCDNGQCRTLPVCNDNDNCTVDACVDGDCFFTPAMAVSIEATDPANCGSACDGFASANPSGGTTPYSYSWSNGETGQSIGGSLAASETCINAGGPQYTLSTNDVFQADWYYNGVTFVHSNATVADIANTVDDDLYRTERNTMDSMYYNIPVSNGKYDVDLHFAEIYYGVPGGNMSQPFTGRRVFDVYIESTLVLDNYDINADAGPATAVIKTFNTTVTDGRLDIKFVSVVNRAKVSAICVRSNAEQSSLCAGTYSVTVTDASGCTATESVTLCANGLKLAGNAPQNNDVLQSFDLKVYPVPFDNILEVEFSAEGSGRAQISLIDMLGQVVESHKAEFEKGRNQSQIILEDVHADGMYFLEFRSGDRVEYVKLYKSR